MAFDWYVIRKPSIIINSINIIVYILFFISCFFFNYKYQKDFKNINFEEKNVKKQALLISQSVILLSYEKNIISVYRYFKIISNIPRLANSLFFTIMSI